MTLADSLLVAAVGIVASLLGAAVGGWFAYRGAVDAARMALEHQAAESAAALARETEHRRVAIVREAALRLKEALETFYGSLEAVRRVNTARAPALLDPADLAEAKHVADVLRGVLTPYAHLTGPEVLDNWLHLIATVDRTVRPQVGGRPPDDPDLQDALTRAGVLEDQLLGLLVAEVTGPAGQKE